MYFKETDTHELLDRHSFHPKHTFDGIVKSQLIRFMRICTNQEDFDKACSLLFKALSEKRHYSMRKLREMKCRFLNNYRQVGVYDAPLGASIKCQKPHCECCLWVEQRSDHEAGDFEYKIYGKISCQSSNLIYVIKCKKCQELYVGETEQTLAKRMHGHLSDIRTHKDTAVATHFNDFCWPETENMILYPIELIPDQGARTKNKSLRLQREAHWINELDTTMPNGMNRKRPDIRNIIISLPYNHTSHKTYDVIRESYQSISEKSPAIFNGQVICAYKKNKNISDHLVRAKLK